MKAIRTLLAVSTLAAAGAAHSATVMALPVTNFNASIVLTMAGGSTVEIVTQSSGSGTATLDDSGTLTITSKIRFATLVGTDNTMDVTTVMSGILYGPTFTAHDTGTQSYSNCMDTGPVSGCGILADGVTITAGSLILGTGGTITSSFANTQAGAVTTFTYSIGTVPVPAAAWLFGSGLLGLAGATSRRK